MAARKPTIRTVAADAQVSVSAVSKVLRNAYGVSDSLHARVTASIERLGYRPRTAARGMRGRTYTVGVLLVELSNPFLPGVVNAIGKTLETANYKPLLAVGQGRERLESSVMESMIDMSMDGLILVAPSLSGDMLADFSRQIPLVAVGHHDPGATAFDTVNGDDRAGGALATRTLLERGYRRVEMLTLPRNDTEAHNAQSRREAGHRDAMRDAGLDARVIRMGSAVGPLPSELAAFLDRADRPEAVFCWSDLHAVALINAARTRGVRVPEDLAIVGYDDSPVAALPLIDLDSVDQDGPGLGALAASTILSRLEGRSEAAHHIVTPRYMARSSC